MLPDTKDEKFRYADPREDISKSMLTKSNTDEATSILAFKREDAAACRDGETIEFGEARGTRNKRHGNTSHLGQKN